MTIRARGLAGLRELAHVGVFVTILTNLGRALELHFFRADWDLVASSALHRTMRAKQGELRFGVVKTDYVGPRPCVVTRFAAEKRPIGAALRHAVLELPMVRVLVTCGAGHIFKDKRQDLIRSARGSYFMTIRAGHGCVRTGQWETSVAVFGDCKGRAMKILNRVATLTLVLIRLGEKLAVVSILVAVQASRKLHLVNGVFARG